MPNQPLQVDGHMNLGHDQSVPMPRDFTAPDNGAFVPQPIGHIVDAEDVDED